MSLLYFMQPQNNLIATPYAFITFVTLSTWLSTHFTVGTIYIVCVFVFVCVHSCAEKLINFFSSFKHNSNNNYMSQCFKGFLTLNELCIRLQKHKSLKFFTLASSPTRIATSEVKKKKNLPYYGAAIEIVCDNTVHLYIEL